VRLKELGDLLGSRRLVPHPQVHRLRRLPASMVAMVTIPSSVVKPLLASNRMRLFLCYTS
jgi:hypothetical protein